jgi:hypothetical protein
MNYSWWEWVDTMAIVFCFVCWFILNLFTPSSDKGKMNFKFNIFMGAFLMGVVVFVILAISSRQTYHQHTMYCIKSADDSMMCTEIIGEDIFVN